MNASVKQRKAQLGKKCRRVVFVEVEGWEEAYLKKQCLAGCRIACFKEHLEEIDLETIRDAVVLSPFIYSQINTATLDRLPALRLIATRSTGFDHIDLAACRGRSILVCNVPDYGQNTVAEHTFALILSISRRIHKTYERTVRGDFSLEGLRGFDLRGKTLGVVGTGSIGSHVIRIAKGFQMNVLAYDVFPRRELAEALQFEYVSLERLLAESDIVTLHCPHNAQTHHLINNESVRRFKRGAVLINTARGGLVQTEALITALDEGILSAIGLDVIEEEDVIKEEKQLLTTHYDPERLKTIVQSNILLRRENVIFTPHNAFNSKEAIERILQTTLANIQAFLDGRPKNLVNP